MILVTGATGHLGGAIIDFLLKKIPADQIAAFIRDPAKAQHLKSSGIDLRQGEYDEYDSLLKAFHGVDKLYFVSGSDIAKRDNQHKNVVNAAKETGVEHVVYSSFQRKNETESSPIADVAKVHLDTERQLKDSDLHYTFMKHTLYMDMLPLYMGDKVLETGTVFLPAGDGKVAFATRKDMAEAAAVVLTSANHENKSYEISGTSSYSYYDIAQIISELSGKKITYLAPSQEIYHREMQKAGVPEVAIGMVATFSEGIKQGEFDFPDPTLKKLLGREPVSVKEFLKTIYNK